jgi:hypothetical protein
MLLEHLSAIERYDPAYQAISGYADELQSAEGDITGAHGEGPHANFEELGPNPARPGRMKVVYNSHVYFND